MPDNVFGLPVHPLIVHATVFVVPTAALAVALYALWPRFRFWAGWGPVALSIAAVVLTPLSTSSGESLQHRIGGSKLIDEHSQLADLLIWWVVPLAVLAAVLFWWHRRDTTTRPAAIKAVLAVLSVAVAVGTLVQVVLIGHSGATASWGDTPAASSQSTGGE
ncbi:MAG: DUF2231 domain-containing protein [Nocardioidaceae bacterium]